MVAISRTLTDKPETPATLHPPGDEFEVAGADFHHVGGDTGHFLAHDTAGAHDGAAAEHGAAAGESAGAVGDIGRYRLRPR